VAQRATGERREARQGQADIGTAPAPRVLRWLAAEAASVVPGIVCRAPCSQRPGSTLGPRSHPSHAGMDRRTIGLLFLNVSGPCSHPSHVGTDRRTIELLFLKASEPSPCSSALERFLLLQESASGEFDTSSWRGERQDGTSLKLEATPAVGEAGAWLCLPRGGQKS